MIPSPMQKSIRSMAKQINQHKSPVLAKSISSTMAPKLAAKVIEKQVTSEPAEPKLVS